MEGLHAISTSTGEYSLNGHKFATNAEFYDYIAGKDRLAFDVWLERFKTRLVDHWKMTPATATEWAQNAFKGGDPEFKLLYLAFAKDPEAAADDDKKFGE